MESYRKTLELESHFGVAHYFLGQALVAAERVEEALEELERAAELTRESSEVLSALAHAHAVAGGDDNRAEAREILRRLLERSQESYVSPVLLAQIHVGLGQAEPALGYLEKALEVRAADAVWLNVRPAFEPLKNSRAFRALVRQAGVEPYRGEDATTLVG